MFTSEQLCLQNIAKMIWKKRGLAKRVGLPFDEETVTQTFLLELAQTYPGYVTIVPFTKQVEGKNGSDWAWSFESVDRAYSYPMMVQAKLLDNNDADYREINRTIGDSSVRQIDRLISVSRRLGFPAYYAFYNHLTDAGRVPVNCRSLKLMNGANMPEAWGVSIAEATAVRSLLPDKSFNTHSAHSYPLHCLLCSLGTGHRGSFGTPGRVAQVFDSSDLDGKSTVMAPDELPPGVRHGTMPIFNRASEAASAEGLEQRENIIERLRKEFPGVDGVVIMRDREED